MKHYLAGIVTKPKTNRFLVVTKKVFIETGP